MLKHGRLAFLNVLLLGLILTAIACRETTKYESARPTPAPHARSAKDGLAARRAEPDEPPVTLNVAVFAYLPDASAAIEQLEDAFERDPEHRNIDLDLALWDPYRDSLEDDGVEQMPQFDVVEIDLCRFDDLQSKLEPLPEEVLRSADSFVEPVKTVLRQEVIRRHALPHWICGNFLVCRADNATVASANTLQELLQALDARAGRPLYGDIYGSAGLGEYYADALLDRLGAEKTRQHLISLAAAPDGQPLPLDAEARDAVVALAREVPDEYRKHFEYYHDYHPYIYPRRFAADKKAAPTMTGYSERLYHVERELQLEPEKEPPNLRPGDLVIRPIPFAAISPGTPTWVDAFVIPTGKLAAKREAIVKFLRFIQSEKGHMPFVQPSWGMAPSYLLPAAASAYDGEIVKKQPVLKEFRNKLDASFPVTQWRVYLGMKRAGKQLAPLVSVP